MGVDPIDTPPAGGELMERVKRMEWNMRCKVSPRFLLALLCVVAAVLAKPAQLKAGCLTVSASGTPWGNQWFPLARKDVFNAEFDATPLGASVDTGIGVTYGAHADFPWLAANIRFNASGYIQALNGSAYASVNAFPYTANTTYHFRFALDFPRRTYSVYVSSPGGPEQLLASGYSFRTGQQNLLLANNWSLFADAGSMRVCSSLAGSASAQPNAVWINTPMSIQNDIFTAQWDAVPTANLMDGVMLFSNGSQNSFGATALGIRFYSNGYIQVLNGSGYDALAAVPYSANGLYHFRAVLNSPAALTSVYVTPPGGTELLLASNYAFRTGKAAVGMLNNFATVVDAGSGTLRTGNFIISGGEDWFGTAMLYPTAPGGREWHANWTGTARTWTWGFDNYDREFEARGNGVYNVDGNGMMITSGDTVRMYVRDPAYDPDTYPGTSYDQSKVVTWNNVEITFYGRRVSETSSVQPYGGLTAAAKIRHLPDADLCATRGYYGRLRNDGHVDLEKEVDHGNGAAQYPYQSVAHASPSQPWSSLPFNIWIGMKLIVRDANNGSAVHLELWRDMNDGKAGGNWQKLWEDNDTGWGSGLIACPGANPAQVMTGPNLSVFIRNDNVIEMNYKNWTIREIPAQ